MADAENHPKGGNSKQRLQVWGVFFCLVGFVCLSVPKEPACLGAEGMEILCAVLQELGTLLQGN